MGDLAARPRGGWQVGNRRQRKADKAPRDAQGRRLLPNGNVDDAPQDCFTVTRAGDGVFHVKHFKDSEDRRACCAMQVTRSARDLAIAHAEGISVDIVTLRRCPECVKDATSTKATKRPVRGVVPPGGATAVAENVEEGTL